MKVIGVNRTSHLNGIVSFDFSLSLPQMSNDMMPSPDKREV